MTTRTIRSGRAVCLALLAFIAACNGDSPTQPGASITEVEAQWLGDATVTSASGSGVCIGDHPVNGTMPAVHWSTVRADPSIELYEDTWSQNGDELVPLFDGTISYRGEIDATGWFVASHRAGSSWDPASCLLREATIEGTFSRHSGSFQAHETLFWGPPQNESRLERHWQVSRK